MRSVVIHSLVAFAVLLPSAHAAAADVRVNPERDVYYGDLHLHTNYSLDAYIMGTLSVDPDKAYRFGKGEIVDYLGEPVQRRWPLDFLAVTDHAELLGLLSQLSDEQSAIAQSRLGKDLKSLMTSRKPNSGHPIGEGAKRIPESVGQVVSDWFIGKHPLPDDLQPELLASAWQREMSFANAHYEPGKFTTFVAFEWTAHADKPAGAFGWAVLHRNVIFAGDSAPFPFTARDSRRPEDLWAWLGAIRKQGYQAIAIPHSGNLSNGLMYDWVDSGGKPIDEAYAETRQANEPLSEISQEKGASETHPLLSPNDEFSNYEIMERVVGTPSYRPGGSYLRDALGRGLVLQHKVGINPFKYGFVGGSDLHSGLSVSAQADFSGGHTGTNLGGNRPTHDEAASILSSPGTKRSESVKRMHTAGNLTAVWAESNTRESIFSALRRRETFATSGTRIKLRFFGGWHLDGNLLKRKDWIRTAYAQAVPMGSDLPAQPSGARAPTFAIWVVKDPNSANLDRVQVIKVWEKDGEHFERVFDVAWSGRRRPDAKTGKLPPVGDTVDLATGQYTNAIGAAELKTLWTDPEFRKGEAAAYYLRALEIPTARWTTLLAIQNRLPLAQDVPATTQQRGWSSPIWYSPSLPLASARVSSFDRFPD